jgi:hypothetical protein
MPTPAGCDPHRSRPATAIPATATPATDGQTLRTACESHLDVTDRVTDAANLQTAIMAYFPGYATPRIVCNVPLTPATAFPGAVASSAPPSRRISGGCSFVGPA